MTIIIAIACLVTGVVIGLVIACMLASGTVADARRDEAAQRMLADLYGRELREHFNDVANRRDDDD